MLDELEVKSQDLLERVEGAPREDDAEADCRKGLVAPEGIWYQGREMEFFATADPHDEDRDESDSDGEEGDVDWGADGGCTTSDGTVQLISRTEMIGEVRAPKLTQRHNSATPMRHWQSLHQPNQYHS